MEKQFILKYRDMKFLVLHDPDSYATNWFDGDWIIHGHTHVNSPFIDIIRKRVNVSVEAIIILRYLWWKFTILSKKVKNIMIIDQSNNFLW